MASIDSRFNANTEEHKTIMMEFNKIKDDLHSFELNISTQIAELPMALQKEFDKRYASKETERFVRKIQWLVIASVVTTLLAVILVDKIYK